MKHLAALAALLMIAACQARPEPVQVSDADSGSSIVLRSGQKLQVTLASNPSTAYRWQLNLPDNAPLRRDGDAQYTAENKPGIVGSGGHEIWNFHATRAGNVALHFEYRRPFDPPDTPAGQVADFNVSVR